MLTCHLQLKMTSKTECSFLINGLFVQIKDLLLLSITNQFSVKFTLILRFVYHLLISLVLFRHSLLDVSGYAQAGLNQSDLRFLKQVSLKNDDSENFINRCFKRFMNTIHVVKEIALKVEKKPVVLLLPQLVSIPCKLGLKRRNH